MEPEPGPHRWRPRAALYPGDVECGEGRREPELDASGSRGERETMDFGSCSAVPQLFVCFLMSLGLSSCVSKRPAVTSTWGCGRRGTDTQGAGPPAAHRDWIGTAMSCLAGAGGTRSLQAPSAPHSLHRVRLRPFGATAHPRGRAGGPAGAHLAPGPGGGAALPVAGAPKTVLGQLGVARCDQDPPRRVPQGAGDLTAGTALQPAPPVGPSDPLTAGAHTGHPRRRRPSLLGTRSACSLKRRASFTYALPPPIPVPWEWGQESRCVRQLPSRGRRGLGSCRAAPASSAVAPPQAHR